MRGRRRTALSLVCVTFALSACSTSPESLEEEVGDEPGVTRVQAEENDGDDFVPVTKIPKRVRVVMRADVSASEVMGVFDVLDGDVDDGDVESIEIVLDDEKRTTFATGAGVHATDAMVEDFLSARDAGTVLKYRREAYPVLPNVELTLSPAALDHVIAVADRYRNVDDIDLVQIRSGDFLLIRDDVNEDPAFYHARETFVTAVDDRFGLTGAVVTGRGQLELMVVPADEEALLGFIDRSAQAESLGPIVVRVQP